MITTSTAETAVKAARRRKLDIPDHITEAGRMHAAVYEVVHTPDPELPAIPGTAEELRQAMADHAQARIHTEHTRAAAGHFYAPVASHYNQLVKAQAPGWIASLQPEFMGLVKTVRSAAKKLPADLRTERLDWTDPTVSGPWQRAEGAAIQLDQLTADRRDIAKVLGPDGGQDAELHAVAAFPQPDHAQIMAGRWLDELAAVVHGWKELRGRPVARWIHLARAQDIQLTLATPGEAEQRARTVRRWQAGSYARATATSHGQAHTAVEQAIRAQAA